MSTLETVIWYVLGYAAMPAIFIGGFLATALIFCCLLEKSRKAG